jgi:WD repeat-containing protein 22
VQPIDLTATPQTPPKQPQYPYSLDLLAHHGCVNAICFSRSEQARWLASGGDDKRVILWDSFADFDQIAPLASFDGPAANIFSIDFSADGRWLIAYALSLEKKMLNLGR